MPNEFNKFLEEIKGEQPSTIEESLGIDKEVSEPEKVEDAQEFPEKGEEPRKNRHHRRLEGQLSKERDARIAAEARAAALLETRGTPSGEIDPLLLQLYGSEERGKEAAAVHQKLLESYAEKARELALNEFNRNQQSQNAEVQKFESYIDEEFEALEDEYDVDLTTNAPAARKARTEILEILEKISPKDEDGNIKEYADMSGVYEMWKLKRQSERPSNERNKDLANRSMTKSGVEAEKAPERSTGWDGWRKDMERGVL